MVVNSLPKTVTRQRRGCDLSPDPSAPESSTLTTRLPSHPELEFWWFVNHTSQWEGSHHTNWSSRTIRDPVMQPISTKYRSMRRALQLGRLLFISVQLRRCEHSLTGIYSELKFVIVQFMCGQRGYRPYLHAVHWIDYNYAICSRMHAMGRVGSGAL